MADNHGVVLTCSRYLRHVLRFKFASRHHAAFARREFGSSKLGSACACACAPCAPVRPSSSLVFVFMGDTGYVCAVSFFLFISFLVAFFIVCFVLFHPRSCAFPSSSFVSLCLQPCRPCSPSSSHFPFVVAFPILRSSSLFVPIHTLTPLLPLQTRSPCTRTRTHTPSNVRTPPRRNTLARRWNSRRSCLRARHSFARLSFGV